MQGYVSESFIRVLVLGLLLTANTGMYSSVQTPEWKILTNVSMLVTFVTGALELMWMLSTTGNN